MIGCDRVVAMVEGVWYFLRIKGARGLRGRKKIEKSSCKQRGTLIEYTSMNEGATLANS